MLLLDEKVYISLKLSSVRGSSIPILVKQSVSMCQQRREGKVFLFDLGERLKYLWIESF